MKESVLKEKEEEVQMLKLEQAKGNGEKLDVGVVHDKGDFKRKGDVQDHGEIGDE